MGLVHMRWQLLLLRRRACAAWRPSPLLLLQA
jgi:hypothetical protein